LIAHFYCPVLGKDDAIHDWIRATLPVAIGDIPIRCRCGARVEARSLPPVTWQPPTMTLPLTPESP
jgi:hypothetical protein